MKKNKLIWRIALLICVVMLLTSTVQTTYCYIVVKTGSIVNTFVPFQSTGNDLLIRKTVEHPFGGSYVIPENIAFDFQVDLGDYHAGSTITTTAGDLTADENGIITVSVKPGNAVGIQGIDGGTKVTVTELQKEGSGFAAKDGVITQDATVSEEGSVTLEFTNIYTPKAARPENVTVTGVKILEGRDWQNGDSFSFLLEQKTDGDTWKTLGTETVTYDPEDPDFNHFDFSQVIQSLEFDRIGAYEFRITEIPGELENVTYDQTAKYFTIQVSDQDMDGSLEILEVTGSEHTQVTGEYNVTLTFNNTFTPPVIPGDITVQITAQKAVVNKGSESIGPENFEFVLADLTTGQETAVRSDQDGLAVFELPYTAADIGKTYHFELTETNDHRGGVTYSTAVYDITVTISLSPDNTLIPEIVCNGEKTAHCVARFENTYDAGTVSTEPVSPPTSDENGLTFWFAMMLLSGTACLLLLALDKRGKAEKR